MLTGRQCIYCLEFKVYDQNNSGTSEFNSEHVIQRAFTRSFLKNLVLQGRVCRTCNSYFDQALDVVLTRKTFAAVQRFRHGMKPLSEFSDFERSTSVEFRGFGQTDVYRGAPMRSVVKDGILTKEFVPHLAVEHGPGIVRIMLSDLKNDSFCMPTFENDVNVTLIESNDSDKEELLAALAKRGISIKITGEVVAGELMIGGKEELDEVALRGIAKIAFNYLGEITQPAYPNLIFDKKFDATRKFIRQGIVSTTAAPRIISVADSRSVRPDHRVETRVIEQRNGWDIVGCVTLFGVATIEVPLGHAFEQRHQLPSNSAHCWDMVERQCYGCEA